jgi:diaminopimelate epimerase
LLAGLVESPVDVVTGAGDLDVEVREGAVFLRGPAVLVASGAFGF